ncbi:LOW QUALITY PROTEIN: hypothetical protein NC651_014587 [Populus alba x Populus x berolinensis]|nr:LOW QUALITY PROTEIN: hypothetical protein NC651_014587 [Populus alba x Populus x berolinensis]
MWNVDAVAPHVEAREMGNKSKKNYLARRDVFNWTERMDDALPVNKGWETGLIVFSQLQPMIIWRGNCVKTSACHLKKITLRITLKNNFKECFDIFNGANGFVWSPENKMRVAKPETGKAFAKPNAKKWMTAPIAHYDELSLLFAKREPSQTVLIPRRRKQTNGLALEVPTCLMVSTCQTKLHLTLRTQTR